MSATDFHTRCCIVGAGPAGMMLGYQLARTGVPVTVLEKHADFLRDFRGDTVHPSTLQLLAELDLLERFEQLPIQRVDQLAGVVGGRHQPVADFRGLKPFDHIALVPQWDFLQLLADAGRQYPHFDLRMCHEVNALVREDGQITGQTADQITGVRVATPDGPVTIRADLVVACDGRASTLRRDADLQPLDLGAPMDVLWFGMPRHANDPDDTFAIVDAGHMMVLINRGDYWQTAFLVPKGGDAKLRDGPIGALRANVVNLAPFLADRHDVPADWQVVSTLQVKVDRLPCWHQRGLLLIGDAAHAMSPIGGVGINLAIQDAVAAANVLAEPLCRSQTIDTALLARIQKRRMLPTRLIQRLQLIIQERMISVVLANNGTTPKVPGIMRWLLSFQRLQRWPARLVGYGIRPEHIRTPARPVNPKH